MYNFIIPCSPSHDIVPKYCHVGASLAFFIIFLTLVVVVVDPLLPDYWGESASVV